MAFETGNNIFKIGYKENNTTEWRGTGFFCGDKGVSALHVVDVFEPSKLFASLGGGNIAPITNVNTHNSKRDIASFDINFRLSNPIDLMTEEVLIGTDVWT